MPVLHLLLGAVLSFSQKSSIGPGLKLRQFTENLSSDFGKLSENCKNGGKYPILGKNKRKPKPQQTKPKAVVKH